VSYFLPSTFKLDSILCINDTVVEQVSINVVGQLSTIQKYFFVKIIFIQIHFFQRQPREPHPQLVIYTLDLFVLQVNSATRNTEAEMKQKRLHLQILLNVSNRQT
jgi:hypothetical protein